MSLRMVVPAGVVVNECEFDATYRVWAGEAAAVRGAAYRRIAEFATTRQCARRALRRLGVAPVAIPAGPGRAPVWPPGVTGSLTHCLGYRGSAVCRTTTYASIGVDAEQHLRPPPEVASSFGRPAEASDLAAAAPEIEIDCLLFSAKEAVYKAWYPMTGRWLDFTDVVIRIPQPTRGSGRFVADVLTARGAEPARFSGRFALASGLLFTAAW